MKFVHIADMHFDSPFVNLSEKNNLSLSLVIDKSILLRHFRKFTKTRPKKSIQRNNRIY